MSLHGKTTLLLIAFSSALVMSSGCAGKPNAITSKTDHFGLVYVAFDGSAGDIYRISDNVQDHAERLTFTPTVQEGVLAASENGDKVIFVANPTNVTASPADLAAEPLNRLYSLDTANGKLVDITNNFGPYTVWPEGLPIDWSLDGNQNVSIRLEGGGYDLKSIIEFNNLEGTNKKDVVVPAFGDIPTVVKKIKWSPDERKLALIRDAIGTYGSQNPGYELVIYNIASGEMQQIAGFQDNCLQSLNWSPNSKQVAVICNYLDSPSLLDEPEPGAIRIFSAENPSQASEHVFYQNCQDPVWSPDGMQLAFVCEKGDNQQGIFVVNSDGGGIHEVALAIAPDPPYLSSLAWSPDGTQILYAAGADGFHESLFLINENGSDNRALTSQLANYRIVSVYPVP